MNGDTTAAAKKTAILASEMQRTLHDFAARHQLTELELTDVLLTCALTRMVGERDSGAVAARLEHIARQMKEAAEIVGRRPTPMIN